MKAEARDGHATIITCITFPASFYGVMHVMIVAFIDFFVICDFITPFFADTV